MGTFSTSSGKRVKKSTIDSNVKKAKRQKSLDSMYTPYCERCGANSDGLDMSHIVSVDECQKSGRSEIAWDVLNIELLCRPCHMEVEQWSKEKRENWYKLKINGGE